MLISSRSKKSKLMYYILIWIIAITLAAISYASTKIISYNDIYENMNTIYFPFLLAFFFGLILWEARYKTKSMISLKELKFMPLPVTVKFFFLMKLSLAEIHVIVYIAALFPMTYLLLFTEINYIVVTLFFILSIGFYVTSDLIIGLIFYIRPLLHISIDKKISLILPVFGLIVVFFLNSDNVFPLNHLLSPVNYLIASSNGNYGIAFINIIAQCIVTILILKFIEKILIKMEY
jgi:hypothetical protein